MRRKSKLVANKLHQEAQLMRCQGMDADWLEIWMIAGLLVDEHGKEAVSVARERADRALFEHDDKENAVWRAVSSAAETYLRKGPRTAQRCH
jgi:hypothetical protein